MSLGVTPFRAATRASTIQPLKKAIQTMSQSALKQFEQNEAAAIERLNAFLAIPSVSTDPAYQPHIEAAAHWVADRLREVGFEPAIMPTEGHPVVLAHTTDAQVQNPQAPRVVFYGHYDVQPPDPVEKWSSDPFEPTQRNGAIYARGACDDKGQVSTFLEALRAYHEAGEKLPCHVTVLIEGEEEMGSKHLPGFLDQHAEQLRGEVAVISDTAMWGDGTPAICYALRGLLYFDVQLHGPSRDLHSGIYGGGIANPATELVKVMGRLLDENHRVTVPGFYDDVQAVADEEMQRWAGLDFDEQQFLQSIGLTEPHGEAGFGTLARRWVRPSCDINGLYGGYMQEGAKTVIPTHAGIKVSFRLAADQDPDKIADAFTNWLHSHAVGGCRWQITEHGRAYPAAVPTDSPWLEAAKAALSDSAGQKPVLMREGATIPVVGDLKRRLGLDSLLIGFGLNSDNIHSPDEHFALDRFRLGARSHIALLQQIGQRV
jgi:acetylornithine deacetylase/succinyl-diaminopimelate desuccinylase-like protein